MDDQMFARLTLAIEDIAKIMARTEEILEGISNSLSKLQPSSAEYQVTLRAAE